MPPHLRGSAHRKQHGIFFTPEPIAHRLAGSVARALAGQAPTVCDPFVGDGALLSAAGAELPAAQLYGTDLQRDHLDLARERLGDDVALSQLDSLASPIASLDPAEPTWVTTFPEVFARGGFDAVIANPPWEKVRVNDREFFSAESPGFSRIKRAERDLRREELLADPAVATRYAAYRARVEHLKSRAGQLYRSAGSGGDLDMYKLAVERCLQLLRPGGVAGLIVPHGVLGDWGARRLRELLLGEHSLLELVRIETGRDLFPEIHANLGVVLMTVRRAAPTKTIRVSAPIKRSAELAAPRFIDLPVATVHAATAHGMLPLVDAVDDLAFLSACAEHPALGEWPEERFKPRREVDMTNDRGAFRPVSEGVPLLEGKHLAPFNLDPALRQRDVAPDAWRHRSGPRVCWRAVADRAMRRRLIAALAPDGVALGNSLIYSGATSPDADDDLFWLLAFLNSRVAEAQLRLWCSNNNINVFHLRACRAPLRDASAEARRMVALAREASAARSASERLADELDALWRHWFTMDDTVWARSVLERTQSVASWSLQAKSKRR